MSDIEQEIELIIYKEMSYAFLVEHLNDIKRIANGTILSSDIPLIIAVFNVMTCDLVEYQISKLDPGPASEV